MNQAAISCLGAVFRAICATLGLDGSGFAKSVLGYCHADAAMLVAPIFSALTAPFTLPIFLAVCFDVIAFPANALGII